MRAAKKWKLMVGLVGLGMVSTACGGGDSTSGDQELLNPGTLTIGLDLTYAPYSYVKDGKSVGFDVEALRLVADEMGVKPKFEDTRFEQVIVGVKGHQFDLTPGLYMTPERADAVDLVPYFSAGSAIVARSSDANPPKTELDLCGLKVSSIKGGAVVAKVNEQTTPDCKKAGKPPVDVREYPTDPEATQALLAGGVDVQLTEGIIAKTVVAKNPGRLTITSDKLLYPVQVGWGIVKGNTKLAEALREALAAAAKSGKFTTLLKKYGLDPHDPEKAQAAVQGGA